MTSGTYSPGMSSSENQRNNRSWTDMSYSSFCNELPEAVGYCSSPFASSASSAESTMDSEYRTSKEDPQCLNCRASLTGEEFITSCPKLVLKPSNDIDRLKGKGIAMKLSRDCIQDDRLVSEGSDMNEGEANEVSFANFCRKWKDGVIGLFTVPFAYKQYRTEICAAGQSMNGCLKAIGSLMGSQVIRLTEGVFRSLKKT
ncbi:hypothetical protein M514_00718, partial [Trichuris suis]